jgi:hypothetical protein
MFIAVRLASRTQMIQALLLGVSDYPQVRRREHCGSAPSRETLNVLGVSEL